MKVKNMTSNNSYNAIPNQFILDGIIAGTFFDGNKKLKSGRAFQSYESIIVFIDYEGRTYLDESTWDYSTTTGKYRNQFLGETKKETQAKIDSGEYILTNLN